MVDHRIETVAILARLAGSPEAIQASGPYAHDVDVAMAPFANHEAVAMTRTLHELGLAYEKPMDFAIHLDGQLNLHDRNFPGERWTTIDPEKYAAAVKQFATDAKLDAFFTAHAAYIAQVSEAFRAQVEANNPLPFFTQVFGPTPLQFVVVPALLQGPQNFGVHLGDAAYQLIGLGEVDAKGLPNQIDSDVIVHEMAHSLVNPAVDQHAAELDPPALTLFPLVEPAMRAQHYTTPRIMMYESIVRAVTAFHASDKPKAIRSEIRRGFVWTGELEAVIEKSGFSMPAIGEFFAGYAKRGVPAQPFLGPIDAVYRQPIAILASPAAKPYASEVAHAVFADKWPVVATPPAGVGLVAYGAPSTNPLVAATLQRAGWKIDRSGIALGAHHWTGDHLLLIASWPREDDPLHGIVVYTAADDADVYNANAMRAGSTDWVVGQHTGAGFTILASGDY